jgi:hypothetical protein
MVKNQDVASTHEEASASELETTKEDKPEKGGKKANAEKTAIQSGEPEDTPTTERQSKLEGKAKVKAQKPAMVMPRKPSSEPTNSRKVVAETQEDITEIDETCVSIVDHTLEEPSPKRPTKNTSRPAVASQRKQTTVARRRAGSASDTERAGSDPALRRKLGDMTKKFENVDLKYRNLREVGVVEANANMEALRKQCDAATSGMSYH